MKNTEIERKWLFHTNEFQNLEKITPKMIHECVYLSRDPEIRISRKYAQGSDEITYKLTLKNRNHAKDAALFRTEIEKRLTEDEFFS